MCALSYVEKCGQSEKVVHTKERGKGWGPISTSTIVLYKYNEKHKDRYKEKHEDKYKEKHKDKCEHKDKIQGGGISTTASFFSNTNTETKVTTKKTKTITNRIIMTVDTIERWRISQE